MSSFDAMGYRLAVLKQWAARMRELNELPSWGTNRRVARPQDCKTVALLIPGEWRKRIESMQAKWGVASFARTAQLALMLGIEVLEGVRPLPDRED